MLSAKVIIAIAIGWQEFFLLYSIVAIIHGGLLLWSSDPRCWRKGGILLLCIPLLFYLLLVLQSAFGPEFLDQPWWLLLMISPWLVFKFRKWSNRERLYGAILLVSLALIAMLLSYGTSLR